VGFYDPDFRELWFVRSPRRGIYRAILSVLAGNWRFGRPTVPGPVTSPSKRETSIGANENVWGAGFKYDFGIGTLIPGFQIPGPASCL
jgi:hypothetical protein